MTHLCIVLAKKQPEGGALGLQISSVSGGTDIPDVLSMEKKEQKKVIVIAVYCQRRQHFL